MDTLSKARRMVNGPRSPLVGFFTKGYRERFASSNRSRSRANSIEPKTLTAEVAEESQKSA